MTCFNGRFACYNGDFACNNSAFYCANYDCGSINSALTFGNGAAVCALCSVIEGRGAVSASRIDFYRSRVGGLCDCGAGAVYGGLGFPVYCASAAVSRTLFRFSF